MSDPNLQIFVSHVDVDTRNTHYSLIILFKIKGGGVQVLKQVTRKVHQLGQLFGRVLGPRPYLGPKKMIIANKAQNQDFLTSIDR